MPDGIQNPRRKVKTPQRDHMGGLTPNEKERLLALLIEKGRREDKLDAMIRAVKFVVMPDDK